MISDTLSKAVSDLDHYLVDEPPFNLHYTGALRERIVALRNEAETIVLILDVAPFDLPDTATHTDALAFVKRIAAERDAR